MSKPKKVKKTKNYSKNGFVLNDKTRDLNFISKYRLI